MNHFGGITPKERYDNEVLEELRAIRQLLERNAQAFEPQPVVKMDGRRGPRKKTV
ncbi:hypothetical protein [Cohnella nanjingensis]|uniref:hypothetical protein n=1 Tax=Cohnella nanjingensis TaxID=1387779 RepID=UPI001C87FC00|nr:hypothetical protein [Cohnella nanjingensis]